MALAGELRPDVIVMAGARGYHVKGASQEEVTRAITSVHAGGVVFGSSLASRIGELLSPGSGRGAAEFPC